MAAYPQWARPAVLRAGKELLKRKMGTTVDVLNILVITGSIKMGSGAAKKEHKLLRLKRSYSLYCSSEPSKTSVMLMPSALNQCEVKVR